MKKLVVGILIGSTLTVSATSFAETVKQYILTEVAYPLFVNGKEYKDASSPILNYEGSTYVPLAKLGDLTGVNYTWNDQMKRVEIVTDGKVAVTPPKDELPSVDPAKGTPATPTEGITLKPDTKIVIQKPKGLVTENGQIVLYAYDMDGNFRGRFTDEDNGAYISAKIDRTPLPPIISEGWIGAGMLARIYDGAEVDYKTDDYIYKTRSSITNQKEFFRFKLPSSWKKETDGETTSNGVKIKLFDDGLYFNIADLQNAGILQK